MEKTKSVHSAKRRGEEKNILMSLYEKGRLGDFPVAQERLRAGVLFMNDFKASVFSQRTIRDYNRMFFVDGKGKNDASDFRYDAADRYMRALKHVGVYGVYALHFLRDEENVRSFLIKHPVLNKGCRRTYKMVYLAINKMLDKLSDFYNSEKR